MSCYVFVAHPAKEHGQRHVVKGRPGLAPANTKSPVLNSAISFKMATALGLTARLCVLFRLHAFGRYRPHTFLEVYLVPGASNVSLVRVAVKTRSNRARAEIEVSSRSFAMKVPIPVGKGSMMPDPMHLRFLRKQVLEMAAQASWVLTIAVPADLGPVQDPLNAAPNPPGGLRLGRPDGFQHLHDQPGVDGPNRERTEHRVGVGLKGIGPLLAVFAVSPAGLVARNKGLPALLERDRLCGLYQGGLALIVAGLDRIYAGE